MVFQEVSRVHFSREIKGYKPIKTNDLFLMLLYSPDGKVWHQRHISDRYASRMIDEDDTLGATPYVCYAVNPQGDPTIYGLF